MRLRPFALSIGTNSVDRNGKIWRSIDPRFPMGGGTTKTKPRGSYWIAKPRHPDLLRQRPHGLAEVKVGLCPPDGSFNLPRLVALSNSMWLLLSGEPVRTEEALRMGLLSQADRQGLAVQSRIGQYCMLIQGDHLED